MRDAAANDAVVLFVGTKKQAADAVRKKQNVQVNTTSTTVGWVNSYELGNYPKRIARLKEIKRMEEEGIFDVLPKKEVALSTNNVHVLKKFLGVSKTCLVSQM